LLPLRRNAPLASLVRTESVVVAEVVVVVAVADVGVAKRAEPPNTSSIVKPLEEILLDRRRVVLAPVTGDLTRTKLSRPPKLPLSKPPLRPLLSLRQRPMKKLKKRPLCLLSPRSLPQKLWKSLKRNRLPRWSL